MPQPRMSFADALKTIDRSRFKPRLEAAQAEREEMLRRFPLESWPTMTLEQYALGGHGKGQDSFCRWMEFKTRNLGGMGGGAASKHLIYKHKNKPGWYFNSAFQNELEAWEQIRNAFVHMFELAEEGKWDVVETLVPLQGGASLRNKSLHLYFPDEMLPISSKEHLRYFLELLEIPEARDREIGAVILNRILLQTIRKRPEFSGWSTLEIMEFLYEWADPRQSRRIVKIAPGENAQFWPECLEGGYICVGWDDVGDLKAFESREEFQRRFESAFADKHSNHKPTLTKKANEVWTLLELEPGDIVIANKGVSEILAVGEVVDPGYEWRDDRSKYRHTVRIEWDTSYARKIEPQRSWALVTVKAVPATLYQAILTKPRSESEEIVTSSIPHRIPVGSIYVDIGQALERKKQVILYGPPGTGKTFTGLRFAVYWLLDRNQMPDAWRVLIDEAAYREAEARLIAPLSVVGASLLTRLTFHPSYSYEDFIEGFRPTETGNGGLSLRLEDGVFKRVCQTAVANPEKTFLVLIDEINRANIAKVFGELLTVLEADKRGLSVVLPQSKGHFLIPPNVYILGTMNTADRSIKLLDVALRRRFAFIELMPDIEILRGGKVGGLPLDDFLEALNRRIAQSEGREKQIGHAFLLYGEKPVSEPDEFASRFRQEILPLLQEYCYDDYDALAGYLGTRLVNTEMKTLDQTVLSDPDLLLEVLETEFCRSNHA